MTPRVIHRVLGYARVSTEDQDAGLEVQTNAIAAKAASKGWEVVAIRQERASGKSMSRRPTLQAILADLKAHKADALVVSKLDRLSRSVADFGTMIELALSQGWHLVMLDLELDTSTPMGEAMASMAMTFAQFERRMIGQRTKEALAIKRNHGVILGRRRVITGDLERRIRNLRTHGSSYARIAAQLNSEGLRAPAGGTWGWTTIAKVVARA